MLRQGDITFIVTGAMGPEHPVSEHVLRHGPGVKDVALAVPDAEAAFELAVERGAEAAAKPHVVEDDRGLILQEGETSERHDWEVVPGSKIERGTEKEILESFWKMVKAKSHRLVSYNGRGYDGPIVMVRSAQLGLSCSRNLVGYRYSIAEHCDLQDVFGFQGARRENYSLDYWCRRFDVESPKGSIDGSQVGRAYRDGRIDDIGEYCLRDVRATAELYRHLEPTLLPHFKGGDK